MNEPSKEHAKWLSTTATVALAITAVAAICLAYEYEAAGGATVIYLACLSRLAWVKSSRLAFYVGLAIGFTIASIHLQFMRGLFGPAAIGLWAIFGINRDPQEIAENGDCGIGVAGWRTFDGMVSSHAACFQQSPEGSTCLASDTRSPPDIPDKAGQGRLSGMSCGSRLNFRFRAQVVFIERCRIIPCDHLKKNFKSGFPQFAISV